MESLANNLRLMIGYKAAGDTTHQPRCKQVDACLKALPDRRPGHRRTGGYLRRDETSKHLRDPCRYISHIYKRYDNHTHNNHTNPRYIPP